MRAAAAILILASACRASSSPGPTAAVTGYCPSIGGAWPWRAELFPGCPIPSIVIDLPVCNGPCPRPCAGSGTGTTGPWSATYAYDDAGHWIATTFPDNPAGFQCTWVGDRLDRCDLGPGSPVGAIRDPAGRLAGFDDTDLTLAVQWNDRGQVVAIYDRTFAYDDRGRLVSVRDGARDDTTTISYDGRGRISGTHDRRFETTWRYDRAGRLARVDRDRHGRRDGSTRRWTTLGYDAQGRIETVDEGGYTGDGGNTTTRYRYDCPAR